MGDMATELGYELLDGFLIEMAPIGHRHGYAARTLANLLGYALGRRAIVETSLRVLAAGCAGEVT